jgi:hypothetical protein
MAQFGSNTGMVSQNLSTVVDGQGNQIVSSDNSFGASPLGIAARTQALYGIPNANFNLTPPDVTLEIDTSNPLPYWEIESEGAITATMYYDETRSQWSVNLDPTSAGSGDFLTLRARSYLLNDSGLTLRQKAYATLEKIGTYSSTNQWNLVLSATYYDANGSALSTYAIGTAAQNATWTGINGFTTSGTAAIDASAVYCDFDFTMTAVATVSGTVTAHLDALLIQTSVTGGGAQSFLVTDTFTSSGTWTRPAGVDYLVAVVAVGAGGGGGGGDAAMGLTGTHTGLTEVRGGRGGAGGRWAILRDVNVSGVATVSVGIGAGGAGGNGTSTSKGTNSYTQATVIGGSAASGGTTTFGTYLTVTGGQGGGRGSDGGTALGSATTPLYPGTPFAQLNGGQGGDGRNNNGVATQGNVNLYSQVPYTTSINAAGANGAAGTISGGTGINENSIAGTGGTAGPVGYGGGGGGGAPTLGIGPDITFRNAGGGGGGGGGGGAKLQVKGASVTWSGTAGEGGNAGTGAGAGGGGGASILIYGASSTGAGGSVQYRDSKGTVFSGAGGTGTSGAVFVTYIA